MAWYDFIFQRPITVIGQQLYNGSQFLGNTAAPIIRPAIQTAQQIPHIIARPPAVVAAQAIQRTPQYQTITRAAAPVVRQVVQQVQRQPWMMAVRPVAQVLARPPAQVLAPLAVRVPQMIARTAAPVVRQGIQYTGQAPGMVIGQVARTMNNPITVGIGRTVSRATGIRPGPELAGSLIRGAQAAIVRTGPGFGLNVAAAAAPNVIRMGAGAIDAGRRQVLAAARDPIGTVRQAAPSVMVSTLRRTAEATPLGLTITNTGRILGSFSLQPTGQESAADRNYSRVLGVIPLSPEGTRFNRAVDRIVPSFAQVVDPKKWLPASARTPEAAARLGLTDQQLARGRAQDLSYQFAAGAWDETKRNPIEFAAMMALPGAVKIGHGAIVRGVSLAAERSGAIGTAGRMATKIGPPLEKIGGIGVGVVYAGDVISRVRGDRFNPIGPVSGRPFVEADTDADRSAGAMAYRAGAIIGRELLPLGIGAAFTTRMAVPEWARPEGIGRLDAFRARTAARVYSAALPKAERTVYREAVNLGLELHGMKPAETRAMDLRSISEIGPKLERPFLDIFTNNPDAVMYGGSVMRPQVSIRGGPQGIGVRRITHDIDVLHPEPEKFAKSIMGRIGPGENFEIAANGMTVKRAGSTVVDTHATPPGYPTRPGTREPFIRYIKPDSSDQGSAFIERILGEPLRVNTPTRNQVLFSGRDVPGPVSYERLDQAGMRKAAAVYTDIFTGRRWEKGRGRRLDKDLYDLVNVGRELIAANPGLRASRAQRSIDTILAQEVTFRPADRAPLRTARLFDIYTEADQMYAQRAGRIGRTAPDLDKGLITLPEAGRTAPLLTRQPPDAGTVARRQAGERPIDLFPGAPAPTAQAGSFFGRISERMGWNRIGIVDPATSRMLTWEARARSRMLETGRPGRILEDAEPVIRINIRSPGVRPSRMSLPGSPSIFGGSPGLGLPSPAAFGIPSPQTSPGGSPSGIPDLDLSAVSLYGRRRSAARTSPTTSGSSGISRPRASSLSLSGGRSLSRSAGGIVLPSFSPSPSPRSSPSPVRIPSPFRSPSPSPGYGYSGSPSPRSSPSPSPGYGYGGSPSPRSSPSPGSPYSQRHTYGSTSTPGYPYPSILSSPSFSPSITITPPPSIIVPPSTPPTTRTPRRTPPPPTITTPPSFPPYVPIVQTPPGEPFPELGENRGGRGGGRSAYDFTELTGIDDPASILSRGAKHQKKGRKGKRTGAIIKPPKFGRLRW